MWISWLQAIALPKKKTISMDFLAKKLEQNNQSLQAAKAEYLAKKEKQNQAMSGFMPKVGGEYSFQNQDETNSNGVKTRSGKRENAQNIKGEVTLNLFKGFGDISAVKEARNLSESARYGYYKKASKIFIDVLETLLKINNVISNIEVAKSSADNREKVYFIAKNKFQNEAIALGDLKTAESEKDTAISTQSEYETQFYGLVAEFVSHYAIPFDDNYIIEMPQDLPKTYEEAEVLMLKNNFDVQEAFYKVKQAEAAAKKILSHFVPSVDGFANGSRRINDEKDKDFQNEYVIGIKANMNFFNGFNDSSKYKEAAHDLASARFGHKAILGRVKAELKTVFTAYKNAWEQKRLLENAVTGFEIAANSAMIQYESGAKNVSDILREQDRLADAKRRFSNNEKDLRLNAWKLTILLGRLHLSLQKL